MPNLPVDDTPGSAFIVNVKAAGTRTAGDCRDESVDDVFENVVVEY
jgi:hypothetical protein